VKQLEELIGVRVFTRQRNNILLTPAGERLLPHAENLLASWQLAVQEVGAPKQQNMQLAIGGTSNLWDAFLQSVLPHLAANFPNLYIRTEINQQQYLIRSLLGGRLDIAVMLNAPSNIDIDTAKIGRLELVMVSNQEGLLLQQVPEYGHVFVDWGTAFNLQQAKLFSEPVAPILHTGQSHIALEFIQSHRGAAYLPLPLVTPLLDEGRLYRVTDAAEINQDVYLVFSKGSDKTTTLGPVIASLESLEIRAEDPVADSLLTSD
jgi:DNA-binding transcriptional LysR family regulator